MSAARHFASNYAQSRTLFASAAEQHGARLETMSHPHPGIDGKRLAIDIAWIGKRDAPHVLVHLSGVHGVEGYCGAAIQTGLLGSGHGRARENIASLFVHAVNPVGFDADRRVTEGNVDLNRNFIDFGRPSQESSAYETLHDALCRRLWEESDEAWRQVRARFVEAHGIDALDRAVSLGQFSHPTGLHFGGFRPTWSRRALEAIYQKYLRTRRRVVVLDYHTGLGPYGYGEVIVCNLQPKSRVAARELFPFATMPGEDAVVPPLNGTMAEGVERVLEDRMIYLAVEYGTRPSDSVLQALQAENWLHWNGSDDSTQNRRIKEAFRDAFYPEEERWKEMVWERGLEIHAKAMAALAD